MSDHPQAPALEPGQSLGDLRASIAAAAADARTSYLGFLTAGLYLAVTVGGTTHEQLVREGGVRLPLLDAQMPIAGFYVVAPLLFLVLHFNLLVQLRLLAEKLRRFEGAVGRLPQADAQHGERALLSAFPFVQTVAGPRDDPTLAALLQLTIWLTTALAPLLVLLGVLIRFLPYHSEPITWLHRGAIALDLALLLALWPGCLWRGEAEAGAGRPPRGAAGARAFLGALACLLLACLLVATLPGEPLERALRPLPRAETEDGRRPFWPTALLLERPTSPFARNLRLHEAELVSESAASATRLDLRGRDLRFADMTGARLARADLRALPYERPSGEGAPGPPACSPLPAGAPVARLEGAKLRWGSAREALLSEARLSGADLQGTDLSGASLSAADLRGADLSDARLQGANLEGACLNGASLRRADLAGAELRGASLVGADLHGARLIEADLSGARLQGAALTEARLWGVGADDGTDLSGADLTGASAAPASPEGEAPGPTVAGGRAPPPAWQPQALPPGRREGLLLGPGGGDPGLRALLGESVAEATPEAYGAALTALLGELACGPEGGRWVARGIVARVAHEHEEGGRSHIDPAALYRRLFESDCPAGSAVSTRDRATLGRLRRGGHP